MGYIPLKRSIQQYPSVDLTLMIRVSRFRRGDYPVPFPRLRVTLEGEFLRMCEEIGNLCLSPQGGAPVFQGFGRETTLLQPTQGREGVIKSIRLFFASFRRKPESSVLRVLQTDWTPVFTGVTAEIQFFHSFQGITLEGEKRKKIKECRKRFFKKLFF